MIKFLLPLIFILSLNTAFSTECRLFKEVLNNLSIDELEGRVGGTSGNLRTRILLTQKLKEMGLEVFTHRFDGGMNIFGLLKPLKGAMAQNPTVFLSSHYDGQKHCDQRSYARSSVCNSTADATAGLTVIFSVIEKIKAKISSPVLIGFFDREEEGLLGSKALISGLKNNPKTKEMFSSLKAMLNLDIIGLNLFKGMENVHLTMGAETGGQELVEDLKEAIRGNDLLLTDFSYALTHNRSDITSIVHSNLSLPVIHFTDGDGSVYHSSADEKRFLNQKKMQELAKILENLIIKIGKKNKKYLYSRPTIYNDMALPHFSDVLKGQKLIQRTLLVKELNDFSTSGVRRLMSLEKQLNKIHSNGPNKFGQKNMLLFSKAAMEFTSLSREQLLPAKGSDCYPSSNQE